MEYYDPDPRRIRIGILMEYKSDLEKRINEDLSELNGVIVLLNRLNSELETKDTTWNNVQPEQTL